MFGVALNESAVPNWQGRKASRQAPSTKQNVHVHVHVQGAEYLLSCSAKRPQLQNGGFALPPATNQTAEPSCRLQTTPADR